MAVFQVKEGVTAFYTTIVKNEVEAPIALNQFATLTLTYYDVTTQAIINSRDSQNVLNANNVTVHNTSGLLTWEMQPADTAMLGETPYERHRALFEWTWGTPTKYGKHTIDLWIQGLAFVP